MGGHGEPVPNMWFALWEKAVVMCSVGPIGALTRSSMDAVCSCPESLALLRSAMLEIINVADKCSAKLADDPVAYVDAILGRFGQMKGGTTSTSRDVIQG